MPKHRKPESRWRVECVPGGGYRVRKPNGDYLGYVVTQADRTVVNRPYRFQHLTTAHLVASKHARRDLE